MSRPTKPRESPLFSATDRRHHTNILYVLTATVMALSLVVLSPGTADAACQNNHYHNPNTNVGSTYFGQSQGFRDGTHVTTTNCGDVNVRYVSNDSYYGGLFYSGGWQESLVGIKFYSGPDNKPFGSTYEIIRDVANFTSYRMWARNSNRLITTAA